jgi:predicted transcriptional regulator
MSQRGNPILRFRAAPEVHRRVDELAAAHGRDRSEELRMAVAYFDTAATLAQLQTPEAKAELGKAHAAAVKKVKDDLRDLTRIAFPTPSQVAAAAAAKVEA